jgi:uncharacterized coiled-coil protein SlyX
VNEKDIIIKNLNDKIYEQGIIIEENKNNILNLNKKLDEINNKLINEIKEGDNKININISNINNNMLNDKKILLEEMLINIMN